jgi:hypothetical protein
MRVKSLILIAMLLMVPAGAGAQNWIIQGAEQYFRVEWQLDQGRRGPKLDGYIYSTWGTAAGNVRLLVEALDGAGKVTATDAPLILGTIPPGDRLYFEVPAPRGAASYRVRVGSYDPVGRGGQ